MSKSNGHANGQATALAKTDQQDVDGVVQQLQELPPWLKAMREAMEGAVSGDDIKAVMKKQVEKAKDGDMKAASFVMNQAHKLMQTSGATRPVTIVQNNYYDTPGVRPDTPIEPGDDAKGTDVVKMRARARAGVPLTGLPGDTRLRPVSDEEEKELRRRQAAQEAEA